MALVVTGVGTLIHVFAIGYMHGDERFHRFFTNLNLFAASMLTLVLAGNYAMLFLGWELVGLCSFLLIGFWYTRAIGVRCGEEGVHRQPDRRLRVDGGADDRLHHLRDSLVQRDLRPGRGGADHRGSPPRSACSSWWVPPASRPRSRSMCGCPTPWKARRRSRR